MTKTLKVDDETHLKLQEAKVELNKRNPQVNITFSDTIDELLKQGDLQ